MQGRAVGPMSRVRRLRWRGWWWKLPLLAMGLSVGQVLTLRFVDPPFSSFMAIRQLEAIAAGDLGSRMAHDWRDLRDISPQLALAVVAAEDQNFARHHGFDFDAIERAQAHNEKMEARARKRGTEVKRLRGASTITQQVAKTEFDDGVYGAQAAARRHFRKDAARLTAAEAARLAAVLPSPRRYDAGRPGPYVQRRANQIQRQMRQMGGTGWLRTLD